MEASRADDDALDIVQVVGKSIEARWAIIRLIELETACPASRVFWQGSTFRVESCEAPSASPIAIVYAIDDANDWCPSKQEFSGSSKFLVKVVGEAIAAFDSQWAAECAERSIEFVYESGEKDDGITRLLDGLGESARQDVASLFPIVCVAGREAAAICERLACEFSGFENKLDIQTKYYRQIVELWNAGAEPAKRENVQAVVLVAEAAPEADDLWARLCRPLNCSTRLLVSANRALDSWALDHQFERLDADSEDPCDGLPRLADALKCTLWSSREAAGGNPHKFQADDDDLDDLFALAADIRERAAKAGDDDSRRRDAADLALRLAATLGLEDDDDD